MRTLPNRPREDDNKESQLVSVDDELLANCRTKKFPFSGAGVRSIWSSHLGISKGEFMSDISACRGQFVWHDLMCTDVNAVLPFYAGLFPEWRMQVLEMGGGMMYRMINAGERDIGGLVPLDRSHGIPSHWIAYIAVENCDATVTRMERLGGKSLVPAISFPGVGRFAVVADPQGAAIKPFQIARPMPVPERPSIGQVCWNELFTTHILEGRKFYAEVFGWDLSDLDMGPMGTYTFFKLAGKEIGGGMNMPLGVDAPPNWLIYFLVDNVDTRTETAERLGAKLYAPPAEIPGIGRFSVVADPAGAAFALFQPPLDQ